MKNGSASAAPGATLKPFQAGQIWQVDDFTLRISLVGKTLVHFKRYKGQAKASQISLSSKPQLEQYLISRKATLVKE